MIGLGVLGLSIHAATTAEAEECCGKCTGSAYCTACKNCSRCAHCSAGGSCGVCAPATPKTNTYAPPKKTVLTGNRVVSAEKVNVRETAAATAKVLYVLKKGETVNVLEILENGWVKVKADNGRITGYVPGNYLE